MRDFNFVKQKSFLEWSDSELILWYKRNVSTVVIYDAFMSEETKREQTWQNSLYLTLRSSSTNPDQLELVVMGLNFDETIVAVYSDMLAARTAYMIQYQMMLLSGTDAFYPRPHISYQARYDRRKNSRASKRLALNKEKVMA